MIFQATICYNTNVLQWPISYDSANTHFVEEWLR